MRKPKVKKATTNKTEKKFETDFFLIHILTKPYKFQTMNQKKRQQPGITKIKINRNTKSKTVFHKT